MRLCLILTQFTSWILPIPESGSIHMYFNKCPQYNFPATLSKSQSGSHKVLIEKGVLWDRPSSFGFDPKLKCSQKYWKAVQLLALIPMRDLHLSHFSLEITTGGAFDKGQMATHGFKGSWRWPNWHHHSSRTPCFSLGMEQRHFCLRSNAANLWARLLIEKDPAKQLIPNIWGPRSLFLNFPTFMSVVGIGYSTTTAPCCSDALVAPFNAPFSVGK